MPFIKVLLASHSRGKCQTLKGRQPCCEAAAAGAAQGLEAVTPYRTGAHTFTAFLKRMFQASRNLTIALFNNTD